MTLGFAIRAVRRRIVLVLVTALVVAGAGFGIGVLWPKTYTSSAQILMGLDLKDSKMDAQTASLYLKDRVATYAELVTADDVVTPVAEDAGLTPDALRKRIVVAIVPETVVLEVSVSAPTPDDAVELTQAVSSRFRSQVSSLNVETGGPKILPAQSAQPQPAAEPDQLHGRMLAAVSALAGLVAGIVVALLVGLVEAGRVSQRASPGGSEHDTAAVPVDSAPEQPTATDPLVVDPATVPPPPVEQPTAGRRNGNRQPKSSSANVPTWD